MWCGVQYLGKMHLRMLEQNVTGALYCEIPEQDLVPHVHNHFANNSVLVDDNAMPCRANMDHEYQTGEDIMHICTKEYIHRHRPLRNWAKFQQFVGCYLNGNTLALVSSVPHCVQALVAACGGNTRY